MWQRFTQWLQRWRAAAPAPTTADDAASADDARDEAAAHARREAGVMGERTAAEFLRARGFRLVTRNWRSPHDRRDEIDLVCRDADVLVFVEVKTRTATALVPGYYSIDARKKRVLRRACAVYLRALRPPPVTFRLDVVEVATHADGTPPEVRHFENVPLFPKHFRP